MDCNDEFGEIQKRFDEIISYLSAHGSILAKIKACYESVMKKIEDINSVRSLVTDQEKCNILRKDTLRNFCLYAMDLESQLQTLKHKNEDLKMSITDEKEKQVMIQRQMEQAQKLANRQTKMDSKRRWQLHFTTAEATDISVLDQELRRFEQELDNIRLETERKHVPLCKKTSLQIQLQEKEKEKLKLENQNKFLRFLFLQLSISLQTAVSVYSQFQSGNHEFKMMTEEILNSVDSITNCEMQQLFDCLNNEDCDEEKETEFVLYCAEKFDELFNIQQYKEAALLAATSPMGSLRNIETLKRFKAISSKAISEDACSSPLFHYCTTMMQSAGLFKPLSVEEAMEFVMCAIQCGQYVRLKNWIFSGNLPLTKEIGAKIFQKCNCIQENKTKCSCGCCEIALFVFQKLDSYFEIAMSLARLGMYHQLFAFIIEKKIQKNDIMSLLYGHPVKDLAMLIALSSPNSILYCDVLEVMLVLSQSGQYSICEEILKEYAHSNFTSISEIIDCANMKPAYVELMQRLADVLSGTQLNWIGIEIVVSKVVHSAIQQAIADFSIQIGYIETHAHSVPVDQTVKEVLERQIIMSATKSQHKLIRNQNIDLDDDMSEFSVNSSTCTCRSTSSFCTSSYDNSDDDNYK